MACDVRIGTSGWHYKHWMGRYYPAGLKPREMLSFYARTFDTVEINNSFYRLPTEQAVADWRLTAPEGFVFAVKGSRFLTHMKKLKDPEAGLDRFLPVVEGLKEKLGPIVFQLPPRWHVNLERLADFLRALPRDHRFAFELRDPTWHTEAVAGLLREHNAAFCAFDIAGFRSPTWVTADFAYVRLHGPTEHAYRGAYSDDLLREWAGRIREWRERLAAVYLYFDNDDAAFAVDDARRLREMV
jgi:uncharacterized protein YecE (DUF72 family)